MFNVPNCHCHKYLKSALQCGFIFNALSDFKNTVVTSMCTLEDFKVHQGGTQEIIVFTATAMACKQGVTSKQEGGGLIGVCVGVWITPLQLIAAEESIQLHL